MLRITTEESATEFRLLLEGRLKGPWVAELEAAYLTRKARAKRLLVDVDGLTEADQAGRYLLALIEREGGVVICQGLPPASLGWDAPGAANPKESK